MAVFYRTTSGPAYKLQLTVNEDSTSVNDNTSTLSWSLDLINNSNSYFDDYAIGRSVVINGTTVYSVDRSVASQFGNHNTPSINLGSGTLTVTHDNDGSKTISVSFAIDMAKDPWTPGGMSGNGSMALTTIPRASSVSCTAAEIGSPATIVINRASDGFTHTLTYAFGGLTGTIATKTAYPILSWTIPDGFYAQIPNAQRGTGTLTCTTYSGDTVIGTSTCSFTATTSAAGCAPSCSLAAMDSNSDTIALTGDNRKIIKGYSNAWANATCAAKHSATISSIKITCSDGQSATVPQTAPQAFFASAAGAYFTATATDSRGYSTTAAVSLTLIDYIKLTCSAAFWRPEPTTGEVALKFSGNYFNGSFGAVANSLTIKWAYKLHTDSNYTQGGTLASGTDYTISGNTYASGTISLGTGFDYTKAYDFILYFQDKLISSNVALLVTQGIPVFYWDKDSFGINGLFKVNDITQPTLVKSGTSGDWHYEKWSDGTAKCWCSSSATKAIQTTEGSLYVSDLVTVPLPSGLFTSVECAFPIANVASDWGAFFCLLQGWRSSTSNIVFKFASGGSWAAAAWTYYLLVIGKWK